MRLESLPVFAGALVALLGLGFVLDAWLPDRPWSTRERRRRSRTERHRPGEALIGLGMIALSVALFGRDRWNYGTVAVLVGAALIAVGAGLNHRFLRELFVFRGAARRGGEKRRTPREIEVEVPLAPTARQTTPPSRQVEKERPIETTRLADTAKRRVDGEPNGGEERMRIR